MSTHLQMQAVKNGIILSLIRFIMLFDRVSNISDETDREGRAACYKTWFVSFDWHAFHICCYQTNRKVVKLVESTHGESF